MFHYEFDVLSLEFNDYAVAFLNLSSNNLLGKWVSKHLSDDTDDWSSTILWVEALKRYEPLCFVGHCQLDVLFLK